MTADFNHAPGDILEFTYFDRNDLFMIKLKTGTGTDVIRYQSEETNMFYVWLKSNRVKEGSLEF